MNHEFDTCSLVALFERPNFNFALRETPMNITYCSSSTVNLGSTLTGQNGSYWPRSFMTSNKPSVGVDIVLFGVFSIDMLPMRQSSLSDSPSEISGKTNRCGFWCWAPVSYKGDWRKRSPADRHWPTASAMLDIPKTVISTIVVKGLEGVCCRTCHSELFNAISNLTLPTCWRLFNVQEVLRFMKPIISSVDSVHITK